MIGDFTGHDMAQAREDGYSAGVQLATQYERILTDLITELVGDDGDGHEMTPDGEACAVCVAIDRAEVRLRDVSMSLSKGHDDE